MILTWICQFCGWANDNNNGPCRACGGHTEMQLVKGKWKEVTIKEPNKPAAALSEPMNEHVQGEGSIPKEGK